MPTPVDAANGIPPESTVGPDRAGPEGTDASGWPAGLVATYQERWVPLTRLAYLLTGTESVAEELVQEVFLRARPVWARLDNPAGYLRTSLVNAVRDWARHQAVADRHRPLRPAVGIDHPDELWDALDRLDDRRRAAVVLRFYEDLPDVEIAGLLGCRPATVRTLIHRALRDLRREIQP